MRPEDACVVTLCWKLLGFGLELSMALHMMTIDSAGAASAIATKLWLTKRAVFAPAEIAPFPVPLRMEHVTLVAAMTVIIGQWLLMIESNCVCGPRFLLKL
jgi:hypothetical protein